MPTIVNPLDNSQLIDVTTVYSEVEYPYGVFSKTGLFTPENVASTMLIAEIDERGLGKMTGFTSRRERDAMRTAKGKKQAIALAIPHIKIEESVTYEDLENKVANWQGMTIEARGVTMNDATLDRLERMSLAMSQNFEYLAFTAVNGVMRDPEDGSEVANMYDIMGVVRLTETLDLTDNNLDIIAWAKALKAKIGKANKISPVIPALDIYVSSADLQAIYSHPSIAPLRANLLTGLGRTGLALASELLYSETVLTTHGVADMFDIGGNVRFINYETSFTRRDGTVVDMNTDGKAFTVIRGARDLYRVAYAPAPYFSQLGKLGTPTYAWRTPIKLDQQFNVGLESSPLFYMTQPELSVDITITK